MEKETLPAGKVRIGDPFDNLKILILDTFDDSNILTQDELKLTGELTHDGFILDSWHGHVALALD